MRKRRLRRREHVLAGTTLVVCAASVHAGVNYTGGSVNFVQDADLSSGVPATFAPAALAAIPAQASMPVPPAYQINNTITSGSASSTAKGSIGFIANNTTASLKLATGTGITQVDPTHIFSGQSSLRININQMNWTPTAPSFGPVATGYFSVVVGGTVGNNGSAQFLASVTFTDGSGNLLCPAINFNQTFTTVGAFSQPFTSNAPMNSPTLSVSAPKIIRMIGFLDFRASNDDGPSDISVISSDVGGAPPTGVYGGSQTGIWGVPSFWMDESASFLTGGVPNQTDARARFARYSDTGSGGTATLFLAAPAVIGTLDVDDMGGPLVIQDQIASNHPLQFDVTAGSAVMNIHPDAGSVRIDAPISLADPLQVIVDSPNGARLTNDVTGATISKIGTGPLYMKNVRLSNLLAIGQGAVQVAAGGGTIGTSKVHLLNIAGSPGSWQSTLDLTDHDLIIDYTSSSPVATIQNQLASGRNGGSWNGPGINTSAADGSRGLGYAEATEIYGNSFGTATFSGQTVDQTSLLVKFTFNGDANLDDQVDIQDLLALAQHYNSTGDWTQGDFTYDNLVNSADLAALAANWQAGVGEGGGPPLDAALANLGLPAVPEPTAAGALLGACILVRRRRNPIPKPEWPVNDE